MKKMKFRIPVLILLFLLALGLWFRSSLTGTGGTAGTANVPSMKEAVLPVLWAESCGRRIDCMRGYLNDTDADIAADTLIILPDDRKLAVSVEQGAVRITGIRYEIRSADLQNLVERTDLDTWETGGDGIRAVLPIQNLVSAGDEYRMEIILDTAEKGEVHYYARIAFDSTGMAPQMLDLAENFSVRNFDYDSARENTMYLEAGDGSESGDLGHVTLRSGFSGLTYGSLSLQPEGEADLRLLEYTGSVGIVKRNFTAAGTDKDGTAVRFRISETFTMRKGPERLYMMDYSRNMQEVFSGDRKKLADGKAVLGTGRQEAFASLQSPSGTCTAFATGGDLWLADGNRNRCAGIWSFAGKTGTDLRSGYEKHWIRILDLTDEGNLTFLVYGYMNRGDREGQVGLSLLQYDADAGSVSERAFVPSGRSSEEVREDVESLCRESSGGVLYFRLGKNFYSLDIRSGEYIRISDCFAAENSAVSADGTVAAWQADSGRFGSPTVLLMDLETGTRKELEAGAGQLIRPIGFIGRDLAVGIAEAENVWNVNGVDRELPFTAIEIVDTALNSQKHYENTGMLISDVQAADTRIHLNRLEKTGEHSFRIADSDTIVCNEKTAGLPVVPSGTSDAEGKIYFVTLPKGVTADKVRTVQTVPVSFSASSVLNVQDPAITGQYTAYGGGEYLGSFRSAGDALEAAYGSMGIVRNGGRMMYCRAATSTIRTLRLGGSTAEKLLNARQNGEAMTDLYGAPLRSVLYFVSRGMPVLGWSDGGVPVIIYAYDQSTVSMYGVQDGTWLRQGIKEAESMFANGKNDFSCLPQPN